MAILCNNCYKELSDEELKNYDLHWRHSGDMYCFSCRIDTEEDE